MHYQGFFNYFTGNGWDCNSNQPIWEVLIVKWFSGFLINVLSMVRACRAQWLIVPEVANSSCAGSKCFYYKYAKLFGKILNSTLNIFKMIN